MSDGITSDSNGGSVLEAYVDSSVDPESGHGVGMLTVWWSDMVAVEEAFALEETSSTVAEYQTFVRACPLIDEAAREFKVRSVVIYSDCAALVNFLNGSRCRGDLSNHTHSDLYAAARQAFSQLGRPLEPNPNPQAPGGQSGRVDVQVRWIKGHDTSAANAQSEVKRRFSLVDRQARSALRARRAAIRQIRKRPSDAADTKNTPFPTSSSVVNSLTTTTAATTTAAASGTSTADQRSVDAGAGVGGAMEDDSQMPVPGAPRIRPRRLSGSAPTAPDSAPTASHIVVGKPTSDSKQPSDSKMAGVGDGTEMKDGGEEDMGAVRLPDRMKAYERGLERAVPGDHAMIIRLDGVSFSKWTRLLLPVFDAVFTRSMILTMNDLVAHFRPATGYTHSDEISLIFAPCPVDPKTGIRADHIYSGRVQKLASVTASYATARFNAHFAEQFRNVPDNLYKSPELIRRKLGRIFFDGRILAFAPNELHELANHMLWRSAWDCHRNCVSSIARQFYRKRGELDGVDSLTMIKRMLKEHRFNFLDSVPPFLKFGVFAKYEHANPSNGAAESSDRKTDMEVESSASSGNAPGARLRKVLDNRSARVRCTPLWQDTLLAKTWPVDHFLPLSETAHIPRFYANQLQHFASTPCTQIEDVGSTLRIALDDP